MKMNPLLKKVSVIIPTMPNRDKHLKRAIESVNNQTYKNIETIIINNDKISATQARNEGIRKSKGEFIAFLDDDDTFYPTKIEKQVKYLLEHLNIPLCITYSHDKRFNQDRINKPPQIITHEMIIKSFNLSSTSTYMVRIYALEQIEISPYSSIINKKCSNCTEQHICWVDFEVGIWSRKDLICDDIRYLLENQYAKKYFDESLPSAHEYDLAIRLSKHHSIGCIPEVLVTQNSTSGQISENWNKKIGGIKAIAKKYKNEYSLTDKIKTFGVVNLFRMAKIPYVGNRIYKVIIPIKKLYER